MLNSEIHQRPVSVLCLRLIGAFALVTGIGCKPPPVVSAPASTIDAKFSVLDTPENPSDGKVIVVAQFMQNGKVIQVASDATVTCNGVVLTFNGLVLGNAERVPQVAPGGTYTFRYNRAGINTNVAITVPARPVFSAPTVAGAAILRSTNFTIHYVAGAGTSVRGDASDGSHNLNNSQQDDGTFDGLDVSGFNAGPGTLGITRTLENALPSTGFLSASSSFSINKTIAITWQ